MRKSPVRDEAERYRVIAEADAKGREFTNNTTRQNIYSDDYMNGLTSEWAEGEIVVDGYLVGGDTYSTATYFISTECHEHENTGQDPADMCICRARQEWLSLYGRGLASQYDDLPDEWEIYYTDDLGKEEGRFSWDVLL